MKNNIKSSCCLVAQIYHWVVVIRLERGEYVDYDQKEYLRTQKASRMEVQLDRCHHDPVENKGWGIVTQQATGRYH